MRVLPLPLSSGYIRVPLQAWHMTRTPRLTSDTAACCWIPLFALRCETARRPELASLPVALVAPDTARPPRVWQVAPLARRAGVKPGMTVSQAIGLCPALKLCEPDPVHYDEQFARLVAALVTVSPVVEPVELGRVFVGTDGLEGLYGEPEGIVEAILMRSAECKGKRREANDPSLKFRTPHSAFRIGWGRGKFVSWVAASRAKPGGSVIVRPGEERKFLASQRLAVLPLDPDTHRRLLQLGVKTLGALVALPEEAVVSQFGRAGRRLWRLAAGLVSEPVVGRVVPEPIVAALTFFTPVGERDLLAHALDKLIDRALGSAPQWLARAGRARARRARARSLLARCSDPEGPVRDAGAHRGAAQDAARAVAARRSRGATRRRVHRLRPGHRGAAAVRARCGRRGSRRATTCAPERRAGDRAPDQTADAVSRHRGATLVPPPRASLRVDRL